MALNVSTLDPSAVLCSQAMKSAEYTSDAYKAATQNAGLADLSMLDVLKPPAQKDVEQAFGAAIEQMNLANLDLSSLGVQISAATHEGTAVNVAMDKSNSFELG